MRKFVLLGLLMFFSLLIFSCLTTGNAESQRNTEQSNDNIQ